MKKTVYISILLSTCAAMAQAQQPSYLSFSLLSPAAYGQTSIGYERFTRGHFSYGAAIGYMQKSYVYIKWESYPVITKGGYIALTPKYYLKKMNDLNRANVYVGLNAIINTTQLYRPDNFYFDDTYNMYGFNVDAGIRHDLGKSGRFNLEYGITVPMMAGGVPHNDQLWDKSSPGLGYVNYLQNTHFVNAHRKPMFAINLQVKL